MVSFSFRARIDYRSLSCTRIDRIPLSSESLSRQSAQSTVHTAIPGDPVSYGENTHMVPRYLLAMGKILKWYPEILLARYSGTMHHHAKDFLWPRGRRGGCCCCSATCMPPFTILRSHTADFHFLTMHIARTYRLWSELHI